MFLSQIAAFLPDFSQKLSGNVSFFFLETLGTIINLCFKSGIYIISISGAGAGSKLGAEDLPSGHPGDSVGARCNLPANHSNTGRID